MNVIITCSKGCQFEMDWSGTTIEEARRYYEQYNKDHHEDMHCLHEYVIVERK